MFLLERISVVSSAYILIEQSSSPTQSGKSFMYMMKSYGLNIEPWGTTIWVSVDIDLKIPICANFLGFLR